MIITESSKDVNPGKYSALKIKIFLAWKFFMVQQWAQTNNL